MSANTENIKEFGNNLTGDITAFNANYSYVSFNSALDTSQISSVDSGGKEIYSRNDFVAMAHTSETVAENPISLIQFDNNLHNIDTATYNVAMYLSTQKWIEKTDIANGVNTLTSNPGLSYIVRKGFFNNYTNFFITNNVIFTKDSVTEGFSGNDSQFNTDINLKPKSESESKSDVLGGKTPQDMSTWTMMNGLKYNIVAGYMDKDNGYFSTAVSIPGKKSGYSSNMTNIATSTNNSYSYGVSNTPFYFSIEWTGYFFADSTGTWKFKISSDDCSYVFINGIMVVDNGGIHSSETKFKDISLNMNTYYPITIQYGQNDGLSIMSLEITKPDGTTFTDGNGYYFNTRTKLPPIPVNNIILPNSSAYSNLSNILSPTQTISPGAVIMDNAITTYSGANYTKSNANAGISRSDTRFLSANSISSSEAFTAEWFGYVIVNISGNYAFSMNSGINHSSIMWLGDTALVLYDTNNAFISNLGSNNLPSVRLSTPQQSKYLVANVPTPVRIQYGQTGGSEYSFNINVYIQNSSGEYNLTSNTGNGYFVILTDSKSNIYEPIQLALALRDDTNSNSKLQTCYVSPINTSNNASNNAKLRSIKSNKSLVYSGISLTNFSPSNSSTSILTLAPNGDLVFSSGSNSVSITSGSSINASCGTYCSQVNTNFTISDFTITRNDNTKSNLIDYFTVESTVKTDPGTKINYESLSITFNTNLYLTYNEDANPTFTYTIKYTVGSGLFATSYSNNTYSTDSNPVYITNLSDMKAAYKSATECQSQVNNNCSFIMRLTNSGTISLSTGRKEIWNSSSLNTGIPSPGICAIVPEWAIALRSMPINTITSATVTSPLNPNPNITGTMGPSQSLVCIYSANGKFKLCAENNNLILKYAIAPNSSNFILKNDTGKYKYTNRTTANPYYLYIVNSDEKINRYFVKNINNSALVDIDINKGGIITYGNTFSQSKSLAQYQNPPISTDSTNMANSTKYTAYSNVDKEACKAICNNDINCGHFYSYQNNGSNTCMVNNDTKAPNSFPKVSDHITNSSLYIRDSKINSSCAYSYPPHKTPSVVNNITTNTEYAMYNDKFNVLTPASGTLAPTIAQEGACGDSNIYGKLITAIGEESTYKFNSYGRVLVKQESFSTSGENFVNNKLKKSDLISSSKPLVEGLVDSIRYIPNYKPSTYCDNITNNYTTAGHLAKCKEDINNNINAIKLYSSKYGNASKRIDANYRNIGETARDISNSYLRYNSPTSEDKFVIANKAEVLADSTIPPLNYSGGSKFEAIDYSGNLIYYKNNKSSPYLRDAMMLDVKQSVVDQNTLYIMGTMAVAALIIILIIVSRR